MALTDVADDLVDRIVGRYPNRRSAVLPLLFLVQATDGYVSPAGVEQVALRLDMTPAEVGAVATFYAMLLRRPVGRHIVSICRTLPCAMRGADRITDALCDRLGIHVGETTADGMFTIEEVECLAACDGAPVVQVNLENYERLGVEDALALVDAVRGGAFPPSAFADQGSAPDPSAVAAYWRLTGLGEPPAELADYRPAPTAAPTAFPLQPPAPSLRENPTLRPLVELRAGFDHGGSVGRLPLSPAVRLLPAGAAPGAPAGDGALPLGAVPGLVPDATSPALETMRAPTAVNPVTDSRTAPPERTDLPAPDQRPEEREPAERTEGSHG